MTRQRLENGLRLAIMFVVVLCIRQTPAESSSATVSVRVLDALSGKPERNATVVYLCDEVPHAINMRAKTDALITVQFPDSCSLGVKLKLYVVPEAGKEGCGGGVLASLEEIKMKGLVADPGSAGGIWCDAKVSRGLVAHPGEVVLFVKKPTWWQAHIAG